MGESLSSFGKTFLAYVLNNIYPCHQPSRQNNSSKAGKKYPWVCKLDWIDIIELNSKCVLSERAIPHAVVKNTQPLREETQDISPTKKSALPSHYCPSW